MLPVENLPSRASGSTTGSNDWVERSVSIEKTARSDTTNLQYSIVNIQFRLVRVTDAISSAMRTAAAREFGASRIGLPITR